MCGVHDIAFDVGLHMMVNQHFEMGGLGNRILQVLSGAVRSVHVNHEEHVGVTNAFSRLHEVFLCHEDLVSPGHPLQEIRERIG